MRTIELDSGGVALAAHLYGALPADRAAVLVHGRDWDASGWAAFAPSFADAGVPALAVDLRGYGGSEGVTSEYAPGTPWTPVLDLRAAKSALRAQGVREIALIGCSMGGHAVLASSLEGDAECVVAVSAPVVPVPGEIGRRVTGRKLYVCASDDSAGATPHVLSSFAELQRPKELRVFDGTEHSIAMLRSTYGAAVLGAIVEFVCRRG
ncbi:hypothetical protein BH18CHL2_BH18CHL2_10580 [soil metagenome]